MCLFVNRYIENDLLEVPFQNFVYELDLKKTLKIETTCYFQVSQEFKIIQMTFIVIIIILFSLRLVQRAS